MTGKWLVIHWHKDPTVILLFCKQCQLYINIHIKCLDMQALLTQHFFLSLVKSYYFMSLMDSQFLPVLNLNLICYQSSAICLKRTGLCGNSLKTETKWLNTIKLIENNCIVILSVFTLSFLDILFIDCFIKFYFMKTSKTRQPWIFVHRDISPDEWKTLTCWWQDNTSLKSLGIIL